MTNLKPFAFFALFICLQTSSFAQIVKEFQCDIDDLTYADPAFKFKVDGDQFFLLVDEQRDAHFEKSFPLQQIQSGYFTFYVNQEEEVLLTKSRDVEPDFPMNIFFNKKSYQTYCYEP